MSLAWGDEPQDGTVWSTPVKAQCSAEAALVRQQSCWEQCHSLRCKPLLMRAVVNSKPCAEIVIYGLWFDSTRLQSGGRPVLLSVQCSFMPKVAQMVERLLNRREDSGSNPLCGHCFMEVWLVRSSGNRDPIPQRFAVGLKAKATGFHPYGGPGLSQQRWVATTGTA